MAHEPAPAAQASDALTVERLVAEPLLRGAVVGGAAGLGRTVEWCLPLSEIDGTAPADDDLHGVAVHLPAVELADPQRARDLVSGLDSRGVPALFAWPRRGRTADLTAAARAADEAGVPLLALAAEADYRHVGQLVATKVLAQTAHVLQYSARVHRALGEVFARGSGLPAMAQAMATLARAGVLVADRDGELLATAAMRGAGPLPDDLPALARALCDATNLDGGTLADEPGGPDTHPREVVLDVDAGPLRAVVAPVSVAGEGYGLVAILETAASPEPHDLAQHRVLAEQGATLTGSEMLRQRSVREAEERARDDFVDALVHGRFTTASELEARSRHHRFDPRARYAVLVVTAPTLQADRRVDVRQAVRAVSPGSVGEAPLTLAAQLGSMVVVVAQVPAEGPARPADPLDERNTVRGYAEQLHRGLSERLGGALRVAYGRAGEGAAGVAASYREARTAVGLAARIEVPPVCGYDELRVFAAIRDVAASDQGRAFARELLEPLRRAEGQTGNLEQVVLAYIAESGNLNAAARRLQLHRNTMLYKLDRATRALRLDVRTADTQFMVWLAHHIDILNATTAALDAELSPPA